MLKVDFYDLNEIDDSMLEFVVIEAIYDNKWLFVQHKERQTWEIPGGHIEKEENPDQAAYRELYEETGAEDFNIIPVCIYSVENNKQKSYGKLYFSLIKKLGELPDFEIKKVSTFDYMPKDITYPQIQPYLHNKVIETINNKYKH
ncbi:NUDIX hydrolase [Abyssisolibacter fermentans]|uniref:NUDIX hydrolase n=1 Tax=Abyssisolibacter fermentans TaxID=1766203 RepID=UPI00082C277B|nr:NUDIX domain-containing protein [Abyssisolibacter fermentans]